MPEPTMNQGHFDPMLTNISVAFMQDPDAFIAAQVFNIVPVQQASSKYTIFPRDAFMRDDVGPRPMGGYANTTGHGLDRDDYHCEEESLAAWLDDRERNNATPPYDPERGKVRLLTAQHMIHRDKRFQEAFMDTAIWGTNITGVASSPGANDELQWNLSTSTPSRAIRRRKRNVKLLTGIEPNVLVIGSDVEIELVEHPDLIDRVKFTSTGAIHLDLSLVAQYFGVSKVVSATGVINTADEGQALDTEWIVGAKDALLVYRPDAPGLDVPAAGYIFAWTGLLGDSAATPAAVWRGRDERAHSDWFEVRCGYDMKVVSPDLGVYFSGIVA